MTCLARNVSSLGLHKKLKKRKRKNRRKKNKIKILFSLKKEKLGILRYKVIAWRIPLTEEAWQATVPWTEKPGGLEFMGTRRVN